MYMEIGIPYRVTMRRSSERYPSVPSKGKKRAATTIPLASSTLDIKQQGGWSGPNHLWGLPSQRTIAPSWAFLSRRFRCRGGRRFVFGS